MKKTIFILSFIFAFSFLLKAQISIKPGAGFNYMHYNRSTGDWDRFGGIGYHFGSTVIVGKQFYFEGGAFWLNNFSEYSQIDAIGGPVQVDHQLSTLRIPLYGGYTIVEGDRNSIVFRVFLGPAFNIPIKVENSIIDHEAPTKGDYNSVTWGGDFGLSFAYGWFFADAAYEFGFSKVFKNTDSFGQAKSDIFVVNVGIRVRL